jgi:hypothetical protein
MMKQIFYGISLCVFFFSLNGYSWGPTGHRTVAEIAQRHMDPAVARAVMKILNGQDLADVANWADEIRGTPEYSAFPPLHYADVAQTYKTYEDSPKASNGDVVVAITTLTEYLKTGNAACLSKVPALAHVDRVEALKLLVHFVGDVHQPLHIGYQSDRGGNDVKVNWMNKWNTNLHSIWDDEMIDLEKLSYCDYAGFLNRRFDGHAKEWSGGTPASWADESLALVADTYIFPDKQPTDAGAPAFIGYSYVDKNREVFRKRIFQGGVRLAALLDSIFAQQ